MATPTPNSSPSASRRASPGLHLGRIFGVEVTLDATLLLVFLLVAMNLGRGTLPRWHPDWSPGLVWGVAVGAAVLFFVSVLLHELAHALVARAQGTRVRGITLFMLGGIAQIEEEPSTPGREFVMAIVGPLTSLAIGFLAGAVGILTADAHTRRLAESGSMAALGSVGPVTTLLLWLGPVNLALGVFNLVPGFPLDGGRVLRSILWAVSKDIVIATVWASVVGAFFGWLLVTSGLLMAFGWVFPIFGGGLSQGLWFVLLGWFLARAARDSRDRVRRRTNRTTPPFHGPAVTGLKRS